MAGAWPSLVLYSSPGTATAIKSVSIANLVIVERVNVDALPVADPGVRLIQPHRAVSSICFPLVFSVVLVTRAMAMLSACRFSSFASSVACISFCPGWKFPADKSSRPSSLKIDFLGLGLVVDALRLAQSSRRSAVFWEENGAGLELWGKIMLVKELIAAERTHQTKTDKREMEDRYAGRSSVEMCRPEAMMGTAQVQRYMLLSHLTYMMTTASSCKTGIGSLDTGQGEFAANVTGRLLAVGVSFAMIGAGGRRAKDML